MEKGPAIAKACKRFQTPCCRRATQCVAKRASVCSSGTLCAWTRRLNGTGGAVVAAESSQWNFVERHQASVVCLDEGKFGGGEIRSGAEFRSPDIDRAGLPQTAMQPDCPWRSGCTDVEIDWKLLPAAIANAPAAVVAVAADQNAAASVSVKPAAPSAATPAPTSAATPASPLRFGSGGCGRQHRAGRHDRPDGINCQQASRGQCSRHELADGARRLSCRHNFVYLLSRVSKLAFKHTTPAARDTRRPSDKTSNTELVPVHLRAFVSHGPAPIRSPASGSPASIAREDCRGREECQ